MVSEGLDRIHYQRLARNDSERFDGVAHRSQSDAKAACEDS